MTQCDRCAHCVSEYVRVDERGGYREEDCELAYEDVWTERDYIECDYDEINDSEIMVLLITESGKPVSKTRLKYIALLYDELYGSKRRERDLPADDAGSRVRAAIAHVIEEDCELADEDVWTDEGLDAMERGECPYFKAPEVPE